MVRYIQKYCKIDGKRAGENNIGVRDLRDMLRIFYFRITRTPLVGSTFLENIKFYPCMMSVFDEGIDGIDNN